MLASTTIFLVLVTAPAQAQTQAVAAREDLAKAVQIAQSLESEPLGKQAKDQRAWLMLWLIEVPDVTVKACSHLLGPLVESKKNYSSELLAQMLGSSAAFIISNPDKSKDDVAVYAAGLKGSLRAYESILKIKPKAGWPFLDDLIEKRTKGELTEFVRQAAVQCK
ncbi:MAG: hypothetical protein O3A53_20930 [Acidobacteria bacterium]|nr:hypothetical protein [Acidobacteriota bacterium]MDA1237243.1 hypothetical protein [Acidobacteriota bacterium]